MGRTVRHGFGSLEDPLEIAQRGAIPTHETPETPDGLEGLL